MSLSTSHKPRECPCYLHRRAPMPLNMAGPCVCECVVPHRADTHIPPAQSTPEERP